MVKPDVNGSRRPAKREPLGVMPAPPSLVRRFALYAGVALLVAGVSAFFFVRQYSTGHAERTAMDHTAYIAEAVLPEELRPSDFAAPVHGRRLAELDLLAHRELLSSGILRVKLYSPGGLVVYSTDHQLIGGRPPEAEEVARALGGESVGDVTSLDAEGGSGSDRTVLESYAPVALRGGRTAGVFELYGDYAPIASDARSIFLPLAVGIAAVLLGLYLSFFPILRRVTRTMRRQMNEIEHKAYHDNLTDLPNRMAFNDRAEAAVADAKATWTRVAVIIIDLDRFKEVNDSLGHDSGDRLLEALASALSPQLRDGDMVARLGGDEFGILAVDIGDPSAVLALAQRVREVLAQPRMVDGVELEVDASVGIALHPEHGDDAETLLRRADVAMYRSKETHAPALYDPRYDHYSPERLSVVSELHRAIGNQELIVNYQPQCDPASGEMRGVEALVRWQHPRRGPLMPAEFIPLAERTGTIRELTGYVLDASLRQCRQWQDEGRTLTVAVNVSARDLLDARFPDEVGAALRAHGVDPGQLELEINEKTALTDLPRARAILHRFRELGVKLAIDDFGTGNSSLAYFRRLPVGALKIDQSFVRQMLDSAADAAIVHSTIDLAHDLGLQVVAEGVETAECNARLAELGCDLVQGHYFGQAMPAADLEAASKGARSPAAPDSAPGGIRTRAARLKRPPL
jgi:diguanylate cyclase (GGDEF)-like protein